MPRVSKPFAAVDMVVLGLACLAVSLLFVEPPASYLLGAGSTVLVLLGVRDFVRGRKREERVKPPRALVGALAAVVLAVFFLDGLARYIIAGCGAINAAILAWQWKRQRNGV
jgi:membrane protein implicated in regulation of membrane protease activity